MKNIKKTYLIVFAVVLLTLAAVVFIYLRSQNKEDVDLPPQNNDSNPMEQQENFTLETEYIGESTWEYTVTGYIPTPCHEYSVEPIVKESYPEQVEIVVEVTEGTDEMCIQVIQEIEASGTFRASPEAEVVLNVVE